MIEPVDFDVYFCGEEQNIELLYKSKFDFN